MGGGDNNFFSKALNNINAGVQFVTGYDARDGSWTTHGSWMQLPDELIGGMFGRNQARAATNQARDQFNVSQQQAQDQIDKTNWQKMSSDTMASSSAAAATAAAKAGGGVNLNNSTPTAVGSNLGGGSKDILGL